MSQPAPSSPPASPPASPPPAAVLRIEAVAQRTGLTKRTIRYYEEIGLLSPSCRSDGGFRLFSDADVARLERINALKDSAGLTLAEIHELLEAESVRERIRERYRATADPREKRAILAESRGVLSRQLALIERKRSALDGLAAEYQERLERIAHLDLELAQEQKDEQTGGQEAVS
jgi:DNA-binding transcriptional MerR regulator